VCAPCANGRAGASSGGAAALGGYVSDTARRARAAVAALGFRGAWRARLRGRGSRPGGGVRREQGGPGRGAGPRLGGAELGRRKAG
jgi:hypothetical protein